MLSKVSNVIEGFECYRRFRRLSNQQKSSFENFKAKIIKMKLTQANNFAKQKKLNPSLNFTCPSIMLGWYITIIHAHVTGYTDARERSLLQFWTPEWGAGFGSEWVRSSRYWLVGLWSLGAIFFKILFWLFCRVFLSLV